MRFKLAVFLKGLLMGLCDIIPGISAGTIAFITGIYEKLINAIKGLSWSLIRDLVLVTVGKGDKKKFGQDIKKLDLSFLLTLGAGILVAIFALSRVMSFLLGHYFSLTMAFFVGLILASAKTIFDHIERHHSLNVVFALVGLGLGVSLAFIIPSVVEPTLGYVFLGGFLAISAMILPGISGSFVLLILGIYAFMLNVINNLFSNLDYFFVFILGAVAGLYVMSRFVSFLFRKDKSKTLYLLLGLVVGSLSVPLGGIYSNLQSFGCLLLTSHIGLFILGILAASVVTHFSKNKYLVRS